MYKRNISDVWEALGRVYLRDFEIMEYYRGGDRKKFVNLVKKRLLVDVWRRMQRYGENKPPFLINQNFIRNGCKAYIEEVDNVKCARMEVKDDAFIISINKNLRNTQKRTYLAHELGHTFLYNLDKIPIEPYYARERSLDLVLENVYTYDEGLVYEIGRFLLIPSNILENYIPRIASINDFIRACETFVTTKDVMVRKLFWDIYEWNSGAKYWKDGFLIFYPISEITTNKELSLPKGNKKVFRGNFFKYFQIKKLWHTLAQILYLALSRPKELITLYDCKDFDSFEPVKFKGVELRIEMKYIPEDYRIYLLGTPDTKNDEK